MERGDYRLSAVDDRLSVENPTLSVRWTFNLVQAFAGAYLPVENAVAAFDPASGKLFVGSTSGNLWALTQEGRELYRFAVGSAVESTPALDPAADELYFGTTGGELVALKASAGTVRWKAALDGPTRQKPLLSRDTVYVVSDTDTVSAFARKDGEVLWRFRREVPERQFNIAGHAGLERVDGKLVTGFSDGSVVALDSSDGRLLWERDTSLDLEGEQKLRFSDVDTTPVRFEKQLLVTSFSGGLYGLSVSSGAVLWREAELTGVTAMARSGRWLVLSSAEQGLVCMDLEQRRIRWRRSFERGAPGKPGIDAETVFVGESEGGFMALSLQSGKEMSRLEYGNGFSAPAAVARGRGFVVTNGGTLLAFAYGY